jgi:hypothetical protein
MMHANLQNEEVGWAKARQRRAHQRYSRTQMVGTLRFAYPTVLHDANRILTTVIARSASDDAIHVSTSGQMDCFAPLAMTKASIAENPLKAEGATDGHSG